MLDKKEITVLSLLASGYKQVELPQSLNCSLQSIKNILRDIKNKTGSNTTEQAVYLCRKIIDESLNESLNESNLKV